MRRHRLDPFSLVVGATLTGMGLLFLFGTGEARSIDLRWVWPLPLVVLGVLIIVTAARGLWQPAPASDPASDTTTLPLRAEARVLEEAGSTAEDTRELDE